MQMQLDNKVLTIKISNSEPVEVSDFAKSMMSLANDYENISTSNPKQPAKLYIKEIRNGSIIAVLAPIAPLAGQLFTEHFDLIENYAAFLKSVFDWLLNNGEKPQINIRNLNNISNLVSPVANDKGATINICTGNSSSNNAFNITVNYYGANTVQNKARQEIEKMKEDEETEIAGDYTQVLMYWAQIAATKNTDQAIIESISPRPIKVIMDENVKQDLILAEPYPFSKVHIVDVNVQTYKGKPKLYKITRYYSSLDKKDD